MNNNEYSNIGICSNLMVIEDGEQIDFTKHIPGDYVGQIYKYLKHPDSKRDLTKRQQIEMSQYMLCLLCGKACAGTCVKKTNKT